MQSQMHDQAVLYIGTHKDELVTVIPGMRDDIQSFDMTDLHTTVETYCTQFALKYPSLISLKGNYTLDRQEFIQMLFATAVNPFEQSRWMSNRALSIPETVQQRRRRYERIAAKVTVAIGVASCRRGREYG